MTQPFAAEQTVEDSDGQLYKMVITGEAEVVRGPLGRFVDLAEQIRAEGLEVPPRIAAVLQALTDIGVKP